MSNYINNATEILNKYGFKQDPSIEVDGGGLYFRNKHNRIGVYLYADYYQIVLDNTKESLYVSNKDITEILARESCVEALDIAYGLLKRLKASSLEKIEIPVDILTRLKNERPNYYEEIKFRNKS